MGLGLGSQSLQLLAVVSASSNECGLWWKTAVMSGTAACDGKYDWLLQMQLVYRLSINVKIALFWIVVVYPRGEICKIFQKLTVK